MDPKRSSTAPALVSLLALGLAACATGDDVATAAAACTPDDPAAAQAVWGGITLPDGFCATVFADVSGRPRHITVRENGDVVVAVYAEAGDSTGGGVVILRDTTNDGRADITMTFGPGRGGSGIAARGESIWLGMDDAVLRYTVAAGALEPSAPPDTIVSGLPAVRSHRAKSLALGTDGALFVNIGSPTNSCQREDRTVSSPGTDPCPDLENRGGIWRFHPNRVGQTQSDGERFATGIRNAVAIAIDPSNGRLYAVQHGRDMLFANWGPMFDQVESAEKPAEELFAVEQGDDFGWPYCYFDPQLQRKVLAPEYGGDGQTEGRCAEKKGPAFAFPAHWAPNGLMFYTGDQFPARYREGVFVAFHGSWNRAPEPQGGYKVVFLPFNAGTPLTGFDTFADGFAGAVIEPAGAIHRPVGLAQAPDGSIYITDDVGGRIWRVFYRGE